MQEPFCRRWHRREWEPGLVLALEPARRRVCLFLLDDERARFIRASSSCLCHYQEGGVNQQRVREFGNLHSMSCNGDSCLGERVAERLDETLSRKKPAEARLLIWQQLLKHGLTRQMRSGCFFTYWICWEHKAVVLQKAAAFRDHTFSVLWSLPTGKG
jgi:hypothetical protein